MTATGAQRLQDGVHLIPSSVSRGSISKHDPTNISASAGQSPRIRAPCPQLISSARIFKTMSLHVDFYSQVSAGISFPSDQKRKATTLRVRITAGGTFHSIGCEWHTPTSLLRLVRTFIAMIYVPHNVVTIYRSMNKQYLSCWILSNTNALKNIHLAHPRS